MGFIFWLSSQPEPETGSPLDFEGGDSIAHLGLYAVLGALLLRATRRAGHRPFPTRPALRALAIGWGYGVLDELHQAFVPTRTPDAIDVLIDGLGAAAGIALAIVISKRKRRD